MTQSSATVPATPPPAIVVDVGTCYARFGMGGTHPPSNRPFLRPTLNVLFGHPPQPSVAPPPKKQYKWEVALPEPKSDAIYLLPVELIELIASYDGDEGLMREDRTVVHKHRITVGMETGGVDRTYGQAAFEASGKYPPPPPRTANDKGVGHVCPIMEHGPNQINLDQLSAYFSHLMYQQMRLAPDEHPLVLPIPYAMSKAHREVLCLTMFETYCVPALFVGLDAALALFGSGRVSGLMTLIGHYSATVLPVHEGEVLSHVARTTCTTGVDEWLAHRLLTRHAANQQNWGSATAEGTKLALSPAQMECIRQLKHQITRVSPTQPKLDFSTAASAAGGTSEHEKTFILPDKKEFRVSLSGDDASTALEPLFQSDACGSSAVSIPKLLSGVIENVELLPGVELSKEIVLAGGYAGAKGFAERLCNELSAKHSAHVISLYSCQRSQASIDTTKPPPFPITLPGQVVTPFQQRRYELTHALGAAIETPIYTVPSNHSGSASSSREYRVFVPSDVRPEHLVWLGASVISCLRESSTFAKHWISKETYDEIGPSVVCRGLL